MNQVKAERQAAEKGEPVRAQRPLHARRRCGDADNQQGRHRLPGDQKHGHTQQHQRRRQRQRPAPCPLIVYPEVTQRGPENEVQQEVPFCHEEQRADDAV